MVSAAIAIVAAGLALRAERRRNHSMGHRPSRILLADTDEGLLDSGTVSLSSGIGFASGPGVDNKNRVSIDAHRSGANDLQMIYN